VLVYSVLGVVAGISGRIFGTLTNSSGWYLALGIILTVAALAMMETLPFDPAALWERMKRRFARPHAVTPVPEHGNVTSVWGAAGLGASSGIISSPCTTPVLTVILAYIAKSQSVGLGLALMVGFSLGLGTLLVLISLFTGALQILPRSGKWMKTVKVVSGLILLGFGEYLIFRAGTVK
jgi:thiol:disulfide interchange protein